MRLNFGKVDAIRQLALCEDLPELQRGFGKESNSLTSHQWVRNYMGS